MGRRCQWRVDWMRRRVVVVRHPSSRTCTPSSTHASTKVPHLSGRRFGDLGATNLGVWPIVASTRIYSNAVLFSLVIG